MKQIANYLIKHPDYQQVYMTDIRSQPYIFLLFYLKTPLPELLKTVQYNKTESASYNTVSTFGKYNFGNWDPIESKPLDNVLYIIGPSQYDGLRYKEQFDIKKVVYFPEGEDAFYLVSKSY
jgi:hypothetical protein